MAELLGFNWNETDLIMYKGNDATSGFKFDIATNTTYFILKLYYKGVSQFTASSSIKYTDGVDLFYYKYTDGNVIFGFSSTVVKFTSGYVMIQNIEDNNISDWMYITTYGSSSMRGWIACPSLEINNSLPAQYFNSSFSTITLAPFVFKTSNVGYFNIPKLYNVVTKTNTLQAESLVLNREQYYTSTSYSDDYPYMPFAFKIEG